MGRQMLMWKYPPTTMHHGNHIEVRLVPRVPAPARGQR